MNNSPVVNLSVNETDIKPYYAFKAAFEVPVLSCYIIIVTLGIFGNLMVCYAIMVDRTLRNNPTTLLLLSLALSRFAYSDHFSTFGHRCVVYLEGLGCMETLLCKISGYHVSHHCSHLDLDPSCHQC